MSASSFVLRIEVSRQVSFCGSPLSRENFFERLWAEFSQSGLQGVHEGTLLTEEAAQKGLETESWTVDAAEAPRERDWIAGQDKTSADLYFESLEQAQSARDRLNAESSAVVIELFEQKPEDWDAQWKASFLSSPDGVPIEPFWQVVPPWTEIQSKNRVFLKINPGAGFGTGTHETTQLCLRAIGEQAGHIKSRQVLDFGSGSGILAVGAALLGAWVDAVEIDELAIDNARENARLNGVEAQIHFSKMFNSEGPYDLVIANILRPVLIEFAPELVRRLAPGGSVILSGLIESDVPEVREAYTQLIGREPVIAAQGEWRSLVWTPLNS